jgi:hypothetical protein
MGNKSMQGDTPTCCGTMKPSSLVERLFKWNTVYYSMVAGCRLLAGLTNPFRFRKIEPKGVL